MKIKRLLLRPLARLAALHAGAQLRAFLDAHRRTAQVQQQLLTELLRCHSETDFGRDHGFARVRSYEDFTKAVPVGTYEMHRPYIERVWHGQTTALLPPGEPVAMFSRTSGTTGQPKHIPVTPRFLSAMRRGWNVWGLAALNDHRGAWLRPILQISSPMRELDSPTGVPCGAISGLLALTQKPIVRRMYVVAPAVADIADPVARCYVTLRCCVGRDVAFITTANPSSTIKLIETGQAHAERLIRDLADGTVDPPGHLPPQVAAGLRFRPDRHTARRLAEGLRRDGRLLPRHFWNPEYLANWTGGTLRLYLRRLGELFGPVPVRDIGLLASEGRFSVPLHDGTAAGVAEITGNFLEFIPAAQAERAQPDTLRAHEVAIGQEYSLVVSNWAGLFRYHMDDRVRVVERLGDSPVFEFLSRGAHTANITGEKITEHQVVEAMHRAAVATGAGVERFVLQGRFAATPFYELRLEVPDGMALGRLATAMDEVLGELNVEYRSKRFSGRLGPIQPVVLAARTLESAEREQIRLRGGRSEQYKHKYLLTDVLE
ncbi:MAG: GH3 auxin-responsive promoter family protein [Phycisphaerae bacterium]|nr:GH3 auxin-responsive promoter family protein [Phycisphaerae bacterium]